MEKQDAAGFVRAYEELDALRAIYCGAGCADVSVVLDGHGARDGTSRQAFGTALANGSRLHATFTFDTPPCTFRISFPSGYPCCPAPLECTVLSLTGGTRASLLGVNMTLRCRIAELPGAQVGQEKAAAGAAGAGGAQEEGQEYAMEVLQLCLQVIEDSASTPGCATAAFTTSIDHGHTTDYDDHHEGEREGQTQDKAGQGAWLRVWVWFHHIMSPIKKGHIQEWSADGLWGVCKVGFPGALYVHGPVHAVQDYIGRLKRLQWQAMVVRHEERCSQEEAEADAAAATAAYPADLGSASASGSTGHDHHSGRQPTRGVHLTEEMALFAGVHRAMVSSGMESTFKQAVLRL